MSATVLRADARQLPLPDASVDLIVTSPPLGPYFGLRSYTDGGAHYAGQIGSEATPGEWLDALWACTAEWVRVLKPEGSLFVNLGDKYSGAQAQNDGRSSRCDSAEFWKRTNPKNTGIPAKSLLGLPWRYAIGCLDTSRGIPPDVVRKMVWAVYAGQLHPEDCERLIAEYEPGGGKAGLGLILRAEVIWAKPNGLPESVTDRVRRAHEQVFHFTRLPRYYAAVDEIREPHAGEFLGSGVRNARYGRPGGMLPGELGGKVSTSTPDRWSSPNAVNPLGKLPGSVWPIPSQPLQVPASLGVDHFAAFPMELPRRIILGWSPPGVCTACHQGRHPVVHTPLAFGNVPECNNDGAIAARGGAGSTSQMRFSGSQLAKWRARNPAQHLGYACACGEEVMPHGAGDSLAAAYDQPLRVTGAALPPTRPAVVLDPFGGTGTTALVASVLGRHGITADLSMDYARLAQWRVNDPGERARAMQVPKPPPPPAGMDTLFDLEGVS